jgi:hypothetical protein
MKSYKIEKKPKPQLPKRVPIAMRIPAHTWDKLTMLSKKHKVTKTWIFENLVNQAR